MQNDMMPLSAAMQSATVCSLLAAAPDGVRRLQDRVNQELQALLDPTPYTVKLSRDSDEPFCVQAISQQQLPVC